MRRQVQKRARVDRLGRKDERRYLHSVRARVVYIPLYNRDVSVASAAIRVRGGGVCAGNAGHWRSFRLLRVCYVLPVLSSLLRSLCRSALLIQLFHKLLKLLLLLSMQVHLLRFNFILGRVNYAAVLKDRGLLGRNGTARIGVRLKPHLNFCMGPRSGIPGEVRLAVRVDVHVNG